MGMLLEKSFKTMAPTYTKKMDDQLKKAAEQETRLKIVLRPLEADEVNFLAKPQWNDMGALKTVNEAHQVATILKGKFGNMDLESSMSQLKDCAGLLRLALMAAGRETCSVPIIELVTSYHTCVGDAITSTRGMTLKS